MSKINYNYLYDKSYYEERIKNKYYVEKDLKAEEYKDALILPYKNINGKAGEGIVSNKGYLTSSSLYDGFTFGENYKSLFKLLDIDVSEWIPIDKPSKFSRIVLPDESFYK